MVNTHPHPVVPAGEGEHSSSSCSPSKEEWTLILIHCWTRRARPLGPKVSTVAVEGYSSPQELEKAARMVKIFLVKININEISEYVYNMEICVHYLDSMTKYRIFLGLYKNTWEDEHTLKWLEATTSDYVNFSTSKLNYFNPNIFNKCPWAPLPIS